MQTANRQEPRRGHKAETGDRSQGQKESFEMRTSPVGTRSLLEEFPPHPGKRGLGSHHNHILLGRQVSIPSRNLVFLENPSVCPDLQVDRHNLTQTCSIRSLRYQLSTSISAVHV